MKRKENGQALAGRWCRRLSGGGWRHGGDCRRLWVPAADGVLPLSPMSLWSLSSCGDTGGLLASVLGSMGILPGRTLFRGWCLRCFRDPAEERIRCICVGVGPVSAV